MENLIKPEGKPRNGCKILNLIAMGGVTLVVTQNIINHTGLRVTTRVTPTS